MEFLVEPSGDCESHLQGGTGSHASDHERSSSSSVSRASNSSPESIKDVDSNVSVQAFNQLIKSGPAAMQQYNSQGNMAYDAPRYSFSGTPDSATFSSSNRSSSEVTPNMMLNFGGVMDRLDPSACSFPGLGELPSNGVDPSGSFTEDLNSAAYEVVGEPDHGCLLQEMLQQHPPHHQQAPQVAAAASHGDWEDSLHVLQEMVHLRHQHQMYNQPQMEPPLTNPTPNPSPNFNSRQGAQFNNNGSAKFPGCAESDLLNLLQFPRVSTPSFGYPSVRGNSHLYSTPSLSDPMNTTAYNPVLNHHFQNSSQRYLQKPPVVEASRLPTAPILLVDLDQERDEVSGKTFGGKREHGAAASAGKGEPRGVNHFATERQRREFLNEKYHTLRSLVPNPTKADRASIVADAIEYVKELKRTVQELQVVAEEKRRAARDASSVKRRRSSTGDGEANNNNNNNNNNNSNCNSNYNGNNTVGSAPGVEINGHLAEGVSPDGTQQRGCSWQQRTSQNGAHVDVRIVHDEVTIKVNQRRSKSCLLLCVVAALQDLQLDLLHATGATVGEQDVFLFNTKSLEGSSTFAGYIAVKLLDALDRHLIT